jgi:hypothetical protein
MQNLRFPDRPQYKAEDLVKVMEHGKWTGAYAPHSYGPSGRAQEAWAKTRSRELIDPVTQKPYIDLVGEGGKPMRLADIDDETQQQEAARARTRILTLPDGTVVGHGGPSAVDKEALITGGDAKGNAAMKRFLAEDERKQYTRKIDAYFRAGDLIKTGGKKTIPLDRVVGGHRAKTLFGLVQNYQLNPNAQNMDKLRQAYAGLSEAEHDEYNYAGGGKAPKEKKEPKERVVPPTRGAIR